MRITRTAVVIAAAFTLVIAGCGAEENPDSSADGNTEDEAVEQPAGGPDDEPSDEPSDDLGDDLGDDFADDPEPEGFSSPLTCDETFLGLETDLVSYTDLYLETNYELEKLVTALGEDFDAYNTDPAEDFVAKLEEHSNSYIEIIADALTAGPPAEAEEWHALTVDSWNRVCQTIADAHEGVVNENDDQVAEAAEALTEFPNLLNDLHANTMVGPGETA